MVKITPHHRRHNPVLKDWKSKEQRHILGIAGFSCVALHVAPNEGGKFLFRGITKDIFNRSDTEKSLWAMVNDEGLIIAYEWRDDLPDILPEGSESDD